MCVISAVHIAIMCKYWHCSVIMEYTMHIYTHCASHTYTIHTRTHTFMYICVKRKTQITNTLKHEKIVVTHKVGTQI